MRDHALSTAMGASSLGAAARHCFARIDPERQREVDAAYEKALRRMRLPVVLNFPVAVAQVPYLLVTRREWVPRGMPIISNPTASNARTVHRNSNYSYRKVAIGSDCMARRAGTSAASSAISRTPALNAASIGHLSPFSPKSWLAARRFSP